jgi:hypothetical protein
MNANSGTCSQLVAQVVEDVFAQLVQRLEEAVAVAADVVGEELLALVCHFHRLGQALVDSFGLGREPALLVPDLAMRTLAVDFDQLFAVGAGAAAQSLLFRSAG